MKELFRRIFSALMAIIIIVSVLCPICFLIAEAGHECPGEDCPVCCAINICENVLKLFGFVSCSLISAAVIRLIAVLISEKYREYFHCDSLISMKVKMTD